mmetsp:Transcript_2529/g.10081  ORF Transcript_2529/g.10081 Transcript_2529/m.10081 type:complete len:340 (+) Transcript_2529:972-1991(+)
MQRVDAVRTLLAALARLLGELLTQRREQIGDVLARNGEARVDLAPLGPACIDCEALALEQARPHVLGEVRCHGRKHERLRLDEAQRERAVQPGRAARGAPQVARVLHRVEARLHRLAEHHRLVPRARLRDRLVDVVLKNLVGEGELAVAHGRRGRNRVLRPRELLREAQDGVVGRGVLEVGVVHGIARVRQREAHGVRRVQVDGLLQRLEVARRLGHLLAIEHQVAVAAVPERPVLLRKQRNVVVQREGEVVLNEVLAGHAQVEGVEEAELAAHGRKRLHAQRALAARHARGDGTVLERVVPHVVCEVGRVHLRLVLAVHLAVLDEVRHSVVRHIDGRV